MRRAGRQAAAPGPRRRSAEPSAPAAILLVEDHADTRDVMGRLLTQLRLRGHGRRQRQGGGRSWPSTRDVRPARLATSACPTAAALDVMRHLARTRQNDQGHRPQRLRPGRRPPPQPRSRLRHPPDQAGQLPDAPAGHLESRGKQLAENPKSEARNPKQIQNPKEGNPKRSRRSLFDLSFLL